MSKKGKGGNILGYIFIAILFFSFIGGAPEAVVTIFGVILIFVLIANLIDIFKK